MCANDGRLGLPLDIGALCMEVKDFGEAVQHLNQAQELIPNNIKLLMRRARAHTSKGGRGV